MPVALIDDGFTVEAATAAATKDGRHADLPVVAFAFRPALWSEVAAWRRCVGTAQEADETARLVAAKVVRWDVVDGAGRPAPVTPEAVRRVPGPIFDQIFDAVVSWAPRHQAAAAGN